MLGATIWLFVIPYVFIGFWYTIRDGITLSVLPISLALILPIIVGYITFGSTYRYRMQMTPLMLLFAAAGWQRYRERGANFVRLYFGLAVVGTLFYVAIKY